MIYATYTQGATNSRWWQLKLCSNFTPNLGKISQFDGFPYFSDGWENNHQPRIFYAMETQHQHMMRNHGWQLPILKRRSSEKPTPPSSSPRAYDLWPKVVIHGHLQDRRKRWKIPCRTLLLFFNVFFVYVGCWQKMKHVLVVTVWNSLIKALLKKQWGTNLWAGSWTGMAVNRKTPPINSFRIYPPKKHISHMTHPYMPWYLFYLFNLLCYVWVKDSWPVRVQAPSNVRRFFRLFVVTAIFVPGLLESLRKQGWLLWLVWCGKCLLSPGRGGRLKKPVGGFYLTKSERPSLKLT